jgi:hypothetical protein
VPTNNITTSVVENLNSLTYLEEIMTYLNDIMMNLEETMLPCIPRLKTSLVDEKYTPMELGYI